LIHIQVAIVNSFCLSRGRPAAGSVCFRHL
jgi:hypothetical protein